MFYACKWLSAVDYPSPNLMCYSSQSLLLHWVATAKSILAGQDSLNSKDYHYKTISYSMVVSYGMVVLYIGISKVWGFLAQKSHQEICQIFTF